MDNQDAFVAIVGLFTIVFLSLMILETQLPSHSDSLTGFQVANMEDNDSSLRPSQIVPLKWFNITIYAGIIIFTCIFIFLELRRLSPIEKEIFQSFHHINIDLNRAVQHYKNANSLLKLSNYNIKKRYSKQMQYLYEKLNQRKLELGGIKKDV